MIFVTPPKYTKHLTLPNAAFGRRCLWTTLPLDNAAFGRHSKKCAICKMWSLEITFVVDAVMRRGIPLGVDFAHAGLDSVFPKRQSINKRVRWLIHGTLPNTLALPF